MGSSMGWYRIKGLFGKFFWITRGLDKTLSQQTLQMGAKLIIIIRLVLVWIPWVVLLILLIIIIVLFKVPVTTKTEFMKKIIPRSSIHEDYLPLMPF